MPARVIGLRTVVYHAPDLARAREWFRAAFGVDPYFDEPYYVGFDVGGYELGLDPDPAAGRPGAGGTVVYWAVEDLDATLAHLSTLDASLAQAATDVGGGVRVAAVHDPFGNVVGLIQSRAAPAR